MILEFSSLSLQFSIINNALIRNAISFVDAYSKDFVEELQLFLKELRDFFNAGSLQDFLDALKPSLDEDSIRLLNNFLERKQKVDMMKSWDDNVVMDCLHSLTTVRALLAGGLGWGLRNDAPDTALAMRQRWRLAEIRAEDYVFVLISRFINNLEERVRLFVRCFLLYLF